MDDNEIEKEMEKISILETRRRASKVSFGMAFRISKLIGKFRRRNSPVKLPPLQEYVHDHEDPLGIVPVLPVCMYYMYFIFFTFLYKISFVFRY